MATARSFVVFVAPHLPAAMVVQDRSAELTSLLFLLRLMCRTLLQKKENKNSKTRSLSSSTALVCGQSNHLFQPEEDD
eukprot:1024659-Amphidinium_carterae.1